jgi:hypothetical protein
MDITEFSERLARIEGNGQSSSSGWVERTKTHPPDHGVGEAPPDSIEMRIRDFAIV